MAATHPSIRLYPNKPFPRCGCDFESWLIMQHLEPSQEQAILKDWRSLPRQDDPLALFPRPKAGRRWHIIPPPTSSGVAFRPAPAKEQFDTHHFASGQTSKSIFEWVQHLSLIQYKVEIVNNSNENLENLTIFFHINQYMDGQPTPIKTGPFSKSLQALPPGESAGFELCPCLYMASDYDVAFKFLGEQHYESFNVDALNIKEKADWGATEYCIDALEVFLQ